MQTIDTTLRMYAIVRGDLNMPPGKLASQAGHAFLDTYDVCLERDPDRAKDYMSDGHGTKVVLHADDGERMLAIYSLALDADIPCALVIDSGHVMPPHFDGTPIVTALGIGPARRDEIQHITGHLNLVK